MKLRNPLTKARADVLYVSQTWLDSHVGVAVTGQINGGSPPAAGVADRIYLCTTAGGSYTLKYLYRDTGSAWEEIVPVSAQIIGVEIDLAGGTDEYAANTAYMWDVNGATWAIIGPVPITEIDGGSALSCLFP